MSTFLDTLAELEPSDIEAYLADVTVDEQSMVNHIAELWDWENAFARPAQCEPKEDYDVWLINAGRGFGKTRTGAEWVHKVVAERRTDRIALVGRTVPDVRKTMIEGEAGILTIASPLARPVYEPSKKVLTWIDGDRREFCKAHTYTAEQPDLLRGPGHGNAWCDELAAWKYPQETWDNLTLGMRLDNPQICVTTTPKPIALLKEIIADIGTIVTGGSTYENIQNVPPKWIAKLLRKFEGTEKGEQELWARILDEASGALWKRKWIDDHRVSTHPDLYRLLIAVDPAVTSGEDSDETGIVVVGLAFLPDRTGRPIDHYYVLEDYSGRYTPNDWGNVVVNAYNEFRADAVVGEVNNGGDLVRTIIHNIDSRVPFEKCWASHGKAVRAEPVSMLYQQGRVHHVGKLDEFGNMSWRHFRPMEDQMCTWEQGEPNQESPDRMEADVWGVTKLMPTSSAVGSMDLEQGLGRKTPQWGTTK